MLAFFRRAVASPWGAGVLGLVLIAFIVTLYEGRSPFGSINISGSSTVATVAGASIDEAELKRRIDNALKAAKQQRPDLDMAQFVSAGGLDQTLDQMIAARALSEFGQQRGLTASNKLIGSMLNQIPAFKSATGAFDENMYRSVLARAGISESDFRKQAADEAIINMLQIPVRGAVKLPAGVTAPYAALMLEARQGQIVTIPSEAFANLPAPTDAELATFYSRNAAKYTLPERRIVRYALFDRERFRAAVAPNDEEIARFYQQNAASYAASDKRGFTQLVIGSQVDAEKALAAVKSGQAIADVAKTLGLSPLKVAPTDEKAFARQTTPDVARAAFAAPKGGIAALVKSGLGFHIVKVDSAETKPAQTLAMARASIVAQLSEQKIDEAAATFVGKLDDEASRGATFDDLVKQYGLTTIVTPAVTAAGLAPDQPAYKPAPEMALILRDAFRTEPNEDPAVLPLGAAKSFALWKLDSVVAAAPRPLAAIRDQVMADARLNAAAKAARTVADAMAASITKGTPLAQAIATAGVRLPPPSPVKARRIDLARSQQRVPPPLAMMFSMVAKKAKPLEMPDNKGYFVVYVDTITRGDVQTEPALMAQSNSELSRLASDEYLGQFLAAVKAEVGTTRNAAAIAALKKSLGGSAASQAR